ncbi:MAG: hypothetical protein QOJ59_5254, partial [Thermomicrobiales bacterium]|nr:hypothetical protein [Thermomicrobiales bacterium]
MPLLRSRSTGNDGVMLRRPAGSRSALVGMLALLVFGVALWQNLSAVADSPFHPDESRWLNRSVYLRDVLQPTSEIWEDRYLTRGQPPMGSYVTGLGLFLQGHDLASNGPWDFHYGNEAATTWNAVKGNMPAPADLIAARRTSAVVGALTCVVVFLIVTSLIHWVGGLVGALFLAFHPLQLYLASLAVSDAVFTLFVAVATLAAISLAGKPSWPRAITLGVILGLGTSTKLSPVFAAIALAGLGGILLADGPLRRLPVAGTLWGRVMRGGTDRNARLGWMLLTMPAIAFATFVVSYPYLWPDPIGRTQTLLDFRQQEMENQARIWPDSAIESRAEAIQRTWHNLEHTYSTSGRVIATAGRAFGRDWAGLGVDIPLALAGLALFASLTAIRGFPTRQLLALAVVGAQSAVILAKLRIDFNRYYLPFVFVCALGVGFLAGQVWIWAQRALSHRHARAELHSPRTVPLRHGLAAMERRRS